MYTNYIKLLIAGFQHEEQVELSSLLDQINTDNTEQNELEYTTSATIDNIMSELNTSSYKICLINSNLFSNNKKLYNQLTELLCIKNKVTIFVFINTTECINNNSTTNNFKYINLNHLDSYWLNLCINNALYNLSLKKEIKRLSHYDTLTGLVNRNLYLNHVKHALDMGRKQKNTCTIIYLNINNFKNINNTHGIKYGDAILIEFAQRIKKSIDTRDIAARIGADEFAILLENYNAIETKLVITQLEQAMNIPFHIQKDKLNIACSIDYITIPSKHHKTKKDVTVLLNNIRTEHYNTL